MACSKCAERRKLMKEKAKARQELVDRRQKLISHSISFKGNSDKLKIKVHGRLPIFCEKAKHTCMIAVFNQCCVVSKEQCDVSNCVFGTEKFDEIIAEYDKKYELGEIKEETL